MSLLKIIRNPLVILLATLSAVSFITGDARAGTVMAAMVALGVALRFFQEARADAAAVKLKAMIRVTASSVNGEITLYLQEIHMRHKRFDRHPRGLSELNRNQCQNAVKQKEMGRQGTLQSTTNVRTHVWLIPSIAYDSFLSFKYEWFFVAFDFTREGPRGGNLNLDHANMHKV